MTKKIKWGYFAGAVAAALLAAGCSSTAPVASSAARGSASSRAERATLGIEARAVTRQLRKKLMLPEATRGAVVAEVLPGGPAFRAGLRPNDVVEEIGAVHVRNLCEFTDAAYNRSSEPVRVVYRRSGASSEATLIPVDQASLFEESCRAGVASGCFRQAWAMGMKNTGAERERALELYGKACAAGSAEACAYEGVRLLENDERKGDTVAVLKRACELRSAGGCATSAFLYATGKFVARDDRRAAALYAEACDLGDALGCYNTALMSDDARGGPRDLPRAVAKYEEACEMGSSAACTNLGFLYENGRGVRKDASRSLALYRRGCDGTSCQRSNLNGCVNLGRAYRDGIGVAKNEGQAASIFEEACGRTLNPDDPGAAENGSRGCSLLGALFLAGDGVKPDLRRGRELSELGCERGDSFGCFNAAAVYTSGSGIEPDRAKAAEFLDKACRGGDSEGCFDLGVAYEKGNGVAADSRRSAELYRQACKLGFAEACKKGKR